MDEDERLLSYIRDILADHRDWKWELLGHWGEERPDEYRILDLLAEVLALHRMTAIDPRPKLRRILLAALIWLDDEETARPDAFYAQIAAEVAKRERSTAVSARENVKDQMELVYAAPLEQLQVIRRAAVEYLRNPLTVRDLEAALLDYGYMPEELRPQAQKAPYSVEDGGY